MNRSVLGGAGWVSLAGLALACSGSVSSEGPGGGGAQSGAAGGATAGSAGGTPSPPVASAGASSGNGGATVDVPTEIAGSGGAPPRQGIPICESPTFDSKSQLVVCSNGFAHRSLAALCGSDATAGSGGASANDGAPSAGAAGALLNDVPLAVGDIGALCSDDSACQPGLACVCDPAAYLPSDLNIPSGKGACVPAVCRTDADCAPGSYCALGTLNFSGDTLPGFACLRADDQCTTDRDCSDGELCLAETKRTCSVPPI